MKKMLHIQDFSMTGGVVAARHNDGVLLTFPEQDGRLVLSGEPMNLGGADWTGAAYLVVELTAMEDFDFVLLTHFAVGEGPDLPFTVISTGVLPGIRITLPVDLALLDSGRMFTPRTPGRLKQMTIGKGVSLREVVCLTLATKKCHKEQSVVIHEIYLSSDHPECKIDSAPVVDRLGQNKHKAWPGKTFSEKEMTELLRKEADLPGLDFTQKGRSRFGGDLSVKWEAAGFFRTHFDGKRWYLVDPDGYRFVSTGIDCCRPGEEGSLDGLADLFEELPDRDHFAEAYTILEKDAFSAKDTGYVSFNAANLIRAFGKDWKKCWMKVTRGRMINWYANTIGNWSDLEFAKYAKIPYVWPLEGFPTTETRIFRDFPDVFSDEYAANAETFARQLEEFKGDQYLIGYFLRNEPEWAVIQNLLIAEKVLANPVETFCKKALIADLRDKYITVEFLNQAWKTRFASFNDLSAPLTEAAGFSDEAKQDLRNFSVKMIKQYVKIPCVACRRVDPDHLNLGMRYAMLVDPLLAEGSENFDVFSFNFYDAAAYEMVRKAGELTGKPVLIGEFHFGAPDMGLLSAGVCSVRTQKDRAAAYRVYIEKLMDYPCCVGAHYFQLNDQALLGRMDGENMQIGVVDVCHKPYGEFSGALSSVNSEIYDIADGKRTVPEPVVDRIPRLMGF